MALDQYQSLIFTHDSIGYTPVGVPEGDEPVRFTQIMFNIDPFIKYINPSNNTQHTYKARFFRDDYEPYDEEQGYSNVFYQEYQFQKTFDVKEMKIVSNSGLVSNYKKEIMIQFMVRADHPISNNYLIQCLFSNRCKISKMEYITRVKTGAFNIWGGPLYNSCYT